MHIAYVWVRPKCYITKDNKQLLFVNIYVGMSCIIHA